MSVNSSFIGIDLYGRAFDGIVGESPGYVERRQTRQKQ